MRFQWSLIFALIFALLVAIFAVVNVEAVPVNYVFGITEIPLILVILGSALVGGLVVGLFGMIRQYRLGRKIKQLEKGLEEKTDVQSDSIEGQALQAEKEADKIPVITEGNGRNEASVSNTEQTQPKPESGLDENCDDENKKSK